MNFLIVRLGALGDIVHTVPAVAALRRAHPDARIDWVVDARHAAFAELVLPVDRVIRLEKATVNAWVDLVRRLRPYRYDVALDFQGLMKSAMLARASGAIRVVGFSIWHLREKGARPFYSEVDAGEFTPHVIGKNLSLLSTVGISSPEIEFPLAETPSAALDAVRRDTGGAPFALINPGAAWPNKRWPVARFGEVASFVRDVRGLRPIVLWGQAEETLARDVVAASGNVARQGLLCRPPQDDRLQPANLAHERGHLAEAHRRPALVRPRRTRVDQRVWRAGGVAQDDFERG